MIENHNLHVWYLCERNKVFISSTDISNENKRSFDPMQTSVGPRKACEELLNDLLRKFMVEYDQMTHERQCSIIDEVDREIFELDLFRENCWTLFEVE